MRRYFWILALGVAVTAWGAGAGGGTAAAEPFWRSVLPGGHGGRPTPKHMDEFNARFAPGTIVVSFGDRRLYHVLRRGQAMSYPIGVPTGDELWSGTEMVSAKRINPSWRPTAEMRRENPELPPFVPGGHPRNPLGVRALYLGSTLYRIHGTDAPWTVGQIVSNGCIRLYNDDVIELYNRVPVGAKVIVTSKRFVPHHS